MTVAAGSSTTAATPPLLIAKVRAHGDLGHIFGGQAGAFDKQGRKTILAVANKSDADFFPPEVRRLSDAGMND